MKSILFICVENRARSQIAEGLARHFLGDKYDVFSAGSKPAARIHPMATAVMAEIGIDISAQKPKSVDEIDLSEIDLIVTLCAEESCPILPGQIKKLNWATTDPAADDDRSIEEIRKFRKVRDEIRKRILTLRASDQTW